MLFLSTGRLFLLAGMVFLLAGILFLLTWNSFLLTWISSQATKNSLLTPSGVFRSPPVSSKTPELGIPSHRIRRPQRVFSLPNRSGVSHFGGFASRTAPVEA